MLIEHSLQWGIIIILLQYLKRNWSPKFLYNILAVFTTLCFFGHGLYAIGYYPQPGFFVDMTINVFGLSESASRLFLKVAGYLDMLICIGIWIPRIRKPVLYYAAIWGGITALARIVGNFNPDYWLYSLNSWWFHAVYRIVHCIGPVIMIVIIEGVKRQKADIQKIQEKFNL